MGRFINSSAENPDLLKHLGKIVRSKKEPNLIGRLWWNGKDYNECLMITDGNPSIVSCSDTYIYSPNEIEVLSDLPIRPDGEIQTEWAKELRQQFYNYPTYIQLKKHEYIEDICNKCFAPYDKVIDIMYNAGLITDDDTPTAKAWNKEIVKDGARTGIRWLSAYIKAIIVNHKLSTKHIY